jgi:hypothetical protein
MVGISRVVTALLLGLRVIVGVGQRPAHNQQLLRGVKLARKVPHCRQFCAALSRVGRKAQARAEDLLDAPDLSLDTQSHAPPHTKQ